MRIGWPVIKSILLVWMTFVIFTPTSVFAANGGDWVKANWENYPDNTGQWTVLTRNKVTSIGSTQNVKWTGFLNTKALKTVDATFEYDFVHDDPNNKDTDNDMIGWTFRHTSSTNNFNDITKQSFYYVTFRGPYDGDGTAPSRSGVFKNASGLEPRSNNDTDNTTPAVGEGRNDFKLLQGISLIWADKKTYHVKITVKDETAGTRIQVWVDGKSYVNVLDKDPLPIGGYGPYTYSQAHAYFSNIEINGASFLNTPPVFTRSSPADNTVFRNNQAIPIKGTMSDSDATGTIAAYYAIDNPDAKQVIQTAASTGKNVAVSGQIPVATVQNLKLGKHTLYVWSEDSEKAVSDKVAIPIVIKDGQLAINWQGSNFSFSTIDLTTGKDGQVTTTLPKLLLQDGTDSNKGYSVSIQATPLKEVTPKNGYVTGTSARSFPSGTLQLKTTGKEAITLGDQGTKDNQPNIPAGNYTIDAAPVTVIPGKANAGSGIYTVSFIANSLSLNYQLKNVFADPYNYPNQETPYETTVTATIVQGP
ncbi:hypothetical protein KY510_002998 [Listeria monocytogenes]|nr:hypothetical protein [Listeria monocytogenes]